MKNLFLIFALLLFQVVQTSVSDESWPLLPEKKIVKTVNKLWKTTDFRMDVLDSVACGGNGRWYRIISAGEKLGLLYNGRVNSCRAGGCAIDQDDEMALSFEFFDYLLFTDTTGKVLRVNIYNYQATHGQEVMSRGWLNQFKGLTGEKRIEFEREIEAISGATVSANAFTDDIQRVLKCLSH